MRGIQVEDWPTFYEKETGKILVTDLRPSWLIFSDGFVKTYRTEIIKRLLDLSLSLVGLALRAAHHGGGRASPSSWSRAARCSSARHASGRTAASSS